MRYNHIAITLFFTLSLSLFPFSAQALINGKILDGTPDLVRLIFKNSWVCTGVFLDKNTILTAAHCIIPEKQEAPIELDYVLSAHDELIDVRQIQLIPHPEFEHSSWPARDVGIIKTTSNINYKGNFKLETDSLHLAGDVTLMGCGKTDPSSNERSRTTGKNNYWRIGSVLFFLGRSRNSPAEMGSEVSVAPNDSGGPILDSVTEKIIGVSTTTTVKQSLQNHLPTLSTGTSTVITPNLEFIQSHLGPLAE